jgi:hypothetical protein
LDNLGSQEAGKGEKAKNGMFSHGGSVPAFTRVPRPNSFSILYELTERVGEVSASGKKRVPQGLKPSSAALGYGPTKQLAEKCCFEEESSLSG